VRFANTQNIICKDPFYCRYTKLTVKAGDYVPVGYWSTIEVHVSVICACLPALPSLFRRELKAALRQNGLVPSPGIGV
jgi:hypothetical protein